MANFREIQPEDIETIFGIRGRIWHNSHGADELGRMRVNHESVRQLMATSHRGWLAESDGLAIGFAMGDKETGEMRAVAVLKEFENQGVGRGLMRLVEDWLAPEGCDQLWLTTDVDERLRAVGFYRHLGWEDWKFEHGDRSMRKQIV